MNYKPIFTKHSVIFELRKPIYGSFYSLRDRWLKDAGDRHIVCNFMVDGKKKTATFQNAQEYMDGAKRMEQEYNFPGNPMIMWGRSLLGDSKKRDERKKVERKLDSPKIEYDTKLKLAQRIRDKNPDLAIKLGLL